MIEIDPEKVRETYIRLGGNIKAVSEELGIARSSVRRHAQNLGIYEKPIVGGRLKAVDTVDRDIPPEGQIYRYLLTSAQNNTAINEKAWDSLLALKKHYGAELLVGTFSYNMNAYGKLSVKRGHDQPEEESLWFDQRLLPYIEATDDMNIMLAPNLMWAGRANIMPTAVNPLSGFETYGKRKSCVFPHVKIAMASIAATKNEATKFNYTTGTVTQQNYIQKKAGLKAELHHCYGALIVEVNHLGEWWCRQVQVDDQGVLYDLDVRAQGDKVTTGNRIEAGTWGDIHNEKMDDVVREVTWGKGGMIDVLKPKYQFMHDLIDFQSRRHYSRNDPHAMFELHCRGQESVETELANAAEFLHFAYRKSCATVIVDSNHDNDFLRWLKEADFKEDPVNAEFYLEAQLAVYRSIRKGEDHHPVEWALRRAECPRDSKFLREDESFILCKKVNGGIENGMHGHLGINGARATPASFAKLGRPATTAHTHSCGIYDDVYVAGVSAKLDQGYNKGPSSWSQSHVLTQPNGMRQIVTIWHGKWRAE